MVIPWKRIVHKEFGIISRTKMLLEFAESGCPFFRATTPLSRCNLKSKGHGKLSIHFAADYPTIETVFRIIAFANQLSLYGAVANMCEEVESHQDRSGQLDVLMGQSIVLSDIEAEVPLENDIPSHQNFYRNSMENVLKSYHKTDRVSKFCMDAGFIHVVEIGQYFLTKDTEDSSLGELVVNTLFQEMTNHHNQKDGFRETQELDPYWKSRPVICTVNMDLKSESGLRVKIILNLGSEFLMDQINS